MNYEIKSAHGDVLTPKQRASTLSFDPPTVAGTCLRRGVVAVLTEGQMTQHAVHIAKLIEDEAILVTPRPENESEAKQLASPVAPPARDDEALKAEAAKAIAETGAPVPSPEEIAAQVAADNAAAEAARVAEAQAAGVVTETDLPVAPVTTVEPTPEPVEPAAAKPTSKKKGK